MIESACLSAKLINLGFFCRFMKSLVILVIWLALIGAIYSRDAPFCALDRIFFSASETALLNHNYQLYFKACFKKQIKLQENGRQYLQLFVSGRLNYAIPKKCNKVVIKRLVEQFWSDVILAISNQTHSASSFDFESTRMISDQISLHSTQLPLCN